MTDIKLLKESLEVLESADCQFWACKGPTLKPIPMATCGVCHMIAQIQDHLERHDVK